MGLRRRQMEDLVTEDLKIWSGLRAENRLPPKRLRPKAPRAKAKWLMPSRTRSWKKPKIRQDSLVTTRDSPPRPTRHRRALPSWKRRARITKQK